MTDFTTLSAVAIVRARDGSSIEDWEEDSGVSADLYLADPDRIRAAVRGLEDAGLSVRGISEVTITFSGTAELMSATFEVAINTDDPANPSWSSTDDTVLSLPVGHHLSAQLSSVRMESAPSPQQRVYQMQKATNDNIMLTDLLVGEVGQTLGSSKYLPERLKKSAAFPGSKELKTSTQASINKWNETLNALPEIKSAKKASEEILGEKDKDYYILYTGRNTWIHIIEPNAGGSPLKWLENYGILGNPHKMLFRSIFNDPSDIYTLDDAWSDSAFHHPCVEVVLNQLWPAINSAQKVITEAKDYYEGLSRTLSGTKNGRFEITTRIAIKIHKLAKDAAQASLRVVPSLSRLQDEGKKNGERIGEDFSLRKSQDKKSDEIQLSAEYEASKLEESANKLDQLSGTHITDLAPFLKQIDSLDGIISNWLLIIQLKLLGDMKKDLGLATSKVADHAQMVAFAINGVTAGSVRAILWGDKDCDVKAESLWSPSLTLKKEGPNIWQNHVLSASYNRKILKKADWPKSYKKMRQELAPSLTDHRRLHVIALGNNSDTPQERGKTRPATCAFLSGSNNVILVGGCEPYFDRDKKVLWRASDATQGYGFKIKSHEFHVPDLCATTKGESGGSMIFPAQDPKFDSNDQSQISMAGEVPKWLTGGGSSQSCPIVAAVAGVVWSKFPELSATQLKNVLLDSAETLQGGEFHFPSGFTTKEQKVTWKHANAQGGDQSRKEGRRRVQLWKAMKMASELYKNNLAQADSQLVRNGKVRDGR